MVVVDAIINKKLLKKRISINDAARVVKYMEMGDDTGGLTKQARTKVQRMMHRFRTAMVPVLRNWYVFVCLLLINTCFVTRANRLLLF